MLFFVECSIEYRGMFNDEGHICTQPPTDGKCPYGTLCFQDGGSPLTQKNKIIGIGSIGDCRSKYKVYTKVSHYVDSFIKKYVTDL